MWIFKILLLLGLLATWIKTDASELYKSSSYSSVTQSDEIDDEEEEEIDEELAA